MSFYTYSLTDAKGNEIPLTQYQGKVVLLVNTATACGFTPQYQELVSLYERFHEQGLEIIDVPCNQFGDQAPGTMEEIQQFCDLNFNTPFPQMHKSHVKGENALPVYHYVTSQKGFAGFGNSAKGLAMAAMMKMKDRHYAKNPDIKWNFTKFVINRSGEVVARFEPTHSLDELTLLIEKLLQDKSEE